MFQVRIHGRGGQGVVSGAEMLSVAAFLEGRHAQAFPSFGSERMGAPGDGVLPHRRQGDPPARAGAGARRADHPGRRRCCTRSTCSAACRRAGYILHQLDAEPRRARARRASRAASSTIALCTLPATELAMKHVGRPVPNAALLGGFAAITGVITLASVVAAIRAEVSRGGRREERRRGDGGVRPSRARRRRRSMLKQTEGSRAVAEAIALCRPQVICAYPITPQTHIVEGLGEMVKSGELAGLRVHQRRIRVRGDVGGDRRVGRRARAPTPRRAARDCSSWPKPCTTPPGSGCRS